MGKEKMMMPLVLLGGGGLMLFSICMFFGFLVLKGGGSNEFVDETNSYSVEFGKPGQRDYGAMCDRGRYASKILLTTKDVGPLVVNKRHARVSKLGLQCSNGTKKFALGNSKDMQTDTSCNSGKRMIGFRSFVTNDAVQRVEPICEGYGQFTNTGSLGSAIGDNNKYICPSGMFLSGFSGTYNDQLKTIRGHCQRV
jgi:hypothetical protein